MRKFFALLAVPLALMSCSKQYIIQGSSTVQSLDGKMLYLKALKGNQLVDIDSCEVIHGQFEFSGTWDSTMMVNLFMDDESIMPLVLDLMDMQAAKAAGIPFLSYRNDKIMEKGTCCDFSKLEKALLALKQENEHCELK